MSARSRLYCPIPGDCGRAPRTMATGRQHGKTGLVRLVVFRTDSHGQWVREEDGLEYHVTDEEWRTWARWPGIAWEEIDPATWAVAPAAAAEPVPPEQLAMGFAR